MSDTQQSLKVDKSISGISLAMQEIPKIFWGRRWYFVVCLLITLGAGLAYLHRAVPIYEVTARVLVESDTGAPKRDDDFLATQAQILRSPMILRRALESSDSFPEELQASALLDALEVRPVAGTDVLTLSFRGEDPQSSLDILRAIIAQYNEYTRKETLRFLETEGDIAKIEDQLWNAQVRLKEASQSLGHKHSEVRAASEQVDHWAELLRQRQKSNLLQANHLASENVRLLESPALVEDAIWPRPYLLLGICTMIGLIGGFGLTIMAESADPKLRSPDQISSQLDLPVLAHIPLVDRTRWWGNDSVQRARLVCESPCSPGAEAFRAFRTRLRVVFHATRSPVILFVSPSVGEGKTLVTANIAASFAQLGKKVAVVDADLRRGTLHEVFAVPTTCGLTSVLRARVSLEEAIVTSSLAGVDVLPRGPHVANPVELLAQPELEDVLEALRHNYDLVLVDTPPLLLTTEASVLAPAADGVVLIFALGQTGTDEAKRSQEILDSLEAPTIGVVANRSETPRNYSYELPKNGAKPKSASRSREPEVELAYANGNRQARRTSPAQHKTKRRARKKLD